ncbi:unnamed protein product, partial [Meganyctiphanes norvegica]
EVPVVSCGDERELHIHGSRHHELFDGSTLANFLFRRQKEHQLLAKFHSVESDIQNNDKELWQELSKLKLDHNQHLQTHGRVKYHPDLIKVNKANSFGVIEEEDEELS